jgi:hypothetical protein
MPSLETSIGDATLLSARQHIPCYTFLNEDGKQQSAANAGPCHPQVPKKSSEGGTSLMHSAKSAWVVTWVVFMLLLTGPCFADDARILLFTPDGETRDVRQVRVQFSEQMVPFGALTLLEPFEIECPEKGRGRWADGTNWVYDFDRDLPAGVVCRFTVKQGVTTLA